MGLFKFMKDDGSIKIFNLSGAGFPLAFIDLKKRTVTFKVSLTRSHMMSIDEVTSISVVKKGLITGLLLVYANAVVVYEIECYPNYERAKECLDFIKSLQKTAGQSSEVSASENKITRLESLECLQRLREQGALNDHEFEEEKKKLLAA